MPPGEDALRVEYIWSRQQPAGGKNERTSPECAYAACHEYLLWLTRTVWGRRALRTHYMSGNEETDLAAHFRHALKAQPHSGGTWRQVS